MTVPKYAGLTARVSRAPLAPARRSSSARLAVTGLVGFAALGMLASVLGPTLPLLQERHRLDAFGSSLLFAAYAAGSAAGVVGAGWLRTRVAPSSLLTGGAALLALGCLALPVAPTGSLALAGVLVAGIGFGLVDLPLNTVLARSFGEGSGAVLMALSAAFGVSAVLLPFLVGRRPDDLHAPYLVCGATALVLTALTATLRLPHPGATGPAGRRHGHRGAVLLLAAVLLGYVAVESGVAGWETTHLRATTSLSESGSASAVSLFWIGLILGRLGAAPVLLRQPPGRLVITCLVAGAASAAAAAHAPSAVVAYAVTGLLIGPVFPAVIAWHASLVPDGRGITGVFAAGLAGPLVGGPLIGLAVGATSEHAVPWVLAAMALAAAGVAVAVAVTVAARGVAPSTARSRASGHAAGA